MIPEFLTAKASAYVAAAALANANLRANQRHGQDVTLRDIVDEAYRLGVPLYLGEHLRNRLFDQLSYRCQAKTKAELSAALDRAVTEWHALSWMGYWYIDKASCRPQLSAAQDYPLELTAARKYLLTMP